MSSATANEGGLSLRPGGSGARTTAGSSSNAAGRLAKETKDNNDAKDSKESTDKGSSETSVQPVQTITSGDEGKYPLEYSWTMWFPIKTQKDYKLMQVYTFKTVETFWALFNHIKNPSEINGKTDIMFFRTGIKPEWEDPFNEGSGSWQAQFPKSLRAQLDDAWLNTVLSLIGNTFQDVDCVAGAVLQLRPKFEDRIQIWIKKVDDATRDRILNTWREILQKTVPSTVTIEINFRVHGEAITGPAPAAGAGSGGGKWGGGHGRGGASGAGEPRGSGRGGSSFTPSGGQGGSGGRYGGAKKQ